MDQKKLLRIIRKDILELNELSEELAAKETVSKIEIEIALSKSRLISQELELLKEVHNPVGNSVIANEPAEPIFEEETEVPKTDDNINEDTSLNGSDFEEEPAPMDIEPEPIVDVPAFEEETETIVDEPQVDPETEIESDLDEETEFENDEEQFEEDFEEETEEEVDDEIEDNFEKEVEEEVEVPSKVVGERFSKERSLNDMMSDNQTLDKKLSASRIEKIESAIGLNDRFLYIRELFNGDSELFRSTVQQLDQMSDIKQAVSHLSTNFKWKKNETSLKFVELVKRRFLS